jgi:hypothetical protein
MKVGAHQTPSTIQALGSDTRTSSPTVQSLEATVHTRTTLEVVGHARTPLEATIHARQQLVATVQKRLPPAPVVQECQPLAPTVQERHLPPAVHAVGAESPSRG